MERKPASVPPSTLTLPDAPSPPAGGPRGSSYVLGLGALRIWASPTAFVERFDLLFGDCRGVAPDGAPRVSVEVEEGTEAWLVRRRVAAPSAGARAPDLLELALDVTADRGHFEGASARRGWRALMARDPSRLVLLARGGTGELPAAGEIGDERGSLAGNLALAATIAAQEGVAFLHAAAVVLDGRAVLIAGDKARGKTTLALSLAARGHGLGGDELAAVHVASGTVHPVRRALSIRRGPRSEAVAALLERLEATEEVYPDGARRLRVRAGMDLRWEPPAPAPLSEILFLRGFAERPRLERVRTGPEHVRQLQLHPSSLRTSSPARRVLALARLLGRARCHWLDAGDPDETAEAVLERLRDRRRPDTR